MLLRTHPHSARDQDGDARKGCGHCEVFLTLEAIIVMPAPGVRTLAPRVMAFFADPVSFDHFSIMKTDNLVVECPAKVGTDRDAIIGDKSNGTVLCIHRCAFP